MNSSRISESNKGKYSWTSLQWMDISMHYLSAKTEEAIQPCQQIQLTKTSPINRNNNARTIKYIQDRKF